MNRHVFAACLAAFAFMFLDCGAGWAQVVVYKQICDHNAYEDWNLKCTINKNTFNTDVWQIGAAGSFKDVESITLCASFSNHGGFNSPATIVHNYKDGAQSKPTDMFDTVKFQGSLTAYRVSWVGTSPRMLQAMIARMQGELVAGRSGFTYTESVSDGRRVLGEIRATCSQIE
jgi:hypothetical protein